MCYEMGHEGIRPSISTMRKTQTAPDQSSRAKPESSAKVPIIDLDLGVQLPETNLFGSTYGAFWSHQERP